MGVGLVVYDLLLLLVACVLYGSATVGATWIAGRVPWPWLEVPVAIVAFLFLLVAVAGVLSALLPRLTAGSHPLMRGRIFYGWLLRSMIRRALLFGPLKTLLFSFNTLRWLSLRALGARVAFTANMSSDVDVLDPALLTMGPGATIGARCLVSGHTIAFGKLRLGRVFLEAGALAGAEVTIGPGARLCAGALVEPRASIAPEVVVGKNARVGAHAVLYVGASVAEGEHVPVGAIVKAPN